ncbi:MAG: aspartate--tRNA(Asn) ligase [Clostridia bacterium]|nr:aspartate--tRNA(Asn) ligase [Clostridia bacterium]
MNITRIKERTPEIINFNQHIGEKITFRCTIYKIRKLRGFAFVVAKTANGNVQCIHIDDEAQFNLNELQENMSVEFKGIVQPEERSRLGFEIHLISFSLLSAPYEPVPVVINGKELPLSPDTMLDYRPITLRNEKETTIFRLQHGLTRGIREFLDNNGFTEIHSPKIVQSGAEGGANIFSLEYFGKKAYLAQSPQFYKQQMTAVFGRVYEIAPVFRAEKHSTSRHLNEYISVDIEMGYIENYIEIMETECAMLSHSFDFLKTYYSDELELLEVTLPDASSIPVISFHDARELISRTFSRPQKERNDFEPEEEKLLSKIIFEMTGSEFVFVTHYPSAKRPFYARDSENQIVTESFDLLFRGLEITTGGMRIHDYEEQVNKMKRKGLEPADFESYLMAHKYGLPPHGGLGMGLERLLAQLLGFSNVRRTSLFPRDTERLVP